MFFVACLIGEISLGQASAGATHHYEVTLAATEGHAQAEVEVTARPAAGTRDVRVSSESAKSVLWMRACEPSAEAIDPKPRRGRLRVSGDAPCLRYRARVERPQQRRGRDVALPPELIVSNPSQWLFLPRLDDEDRVEVTIALPVGMSLSVPWTRVGPNKYLIPASPRSSSAMVIAGRFPLIDVVVPGGVLRVANLSGNADAIPWLRTAALDVARLYGRFPNPSPQVIVLPAPSRRSDSLGVGFVQVMRNGGETVRFFIDPAATAENMNQDWTAPHEFSHLLLPYVSDKWVSEGFASYYQNVLMARRGQYTPEQAWTKLASSFDKAAAIRNPPRLSDMDRRDFWEVRMLVYWSGAAVALLADARLREVSDGTQSLDSALGQLQACCLPGVKSWRAEELFSKLDQLTGRTVFMDLYAEHIGRRGMPATQPLFERLGLRYANGSVRRVNGELSDIRDAIMSGEGI